MNRRGFLSALLGAATLDPERLLWRPGARLISIPRPIEIKSGIRIVRSAELGEYIVVDTVTREILEQLRENLMFHTSPFAVMNPRIGDIIRVRRPARFRAVQP